MSYYPILVDLEGKKVIVVGGGTVAQRKIETILQYGAIVHVISRELTPELNRYVEEGRIERMGQEFRGEHLDGAFMVIAATDDAAFNRQVSEKAEEMGLLINAVDQPADCNFIVPSILRRGDLQIAVSTSGKSPALAKKVREELEASFGREYETLLVLMGRLRKEVLSQGFTQPENRRIFHELVRSQILDAIAREDWNEVAEILGTILQTELSKDDVMHYLEVE